MHSWIQNHILLEVTRHKTRRYSELRPWDVEGNLFMYHLKGLLKEGLVEKNDREYRLSKKGLQFIGTYSLETSKTRKQPKILTTVVCKNEADEYLFSRWHRQPNVGQVSFPHGMVHYGQPITAMAALELAEKAGMEAELAYKGDVYVRGWHNSEVDRHMLVHIFIANQWRGGRESDIRTEVSEPFWAPLESVPKDEFVPGFYEIAQLVATDAQKDGFYFAEFDIDVDL